MLHIHTYRNIIHLRELKKKKTTTISIDDKKLAPKKNGTIKKPTKRSTMTAPAAMVTYGAHENAQTQRCKKKKILGASFGRTF